jgi:hypothetical protein
MRISIRYFKVKFTFSLLCYFAFYNNPGTGLEAQRSLGKCPIGIVRRGSHGSRSE